MTPFLLVGRDEAARSPPAPSRPRGGSVGRAGPDDALTRLTAVRRAATDADGGPLRARQRGLAPQPRGDAPARRRPAGAPAAARPSRRRGRRRRALRLPGRPVGAAPGDAAVLPPDRLRDGDAARGEIRRLNELHRDDPRAPAYARRATPTLVAVGPRDARRLDDRRLRRLDRAAAARRARRATTRRRCRSGGPSGSRPTCFPPTSTSFEAYVAVDARARRARSMVGDVARELAGTSCIRRSGRCCRRLAGRAARRRTRWTLWPSIGLLPRAVRDGYGLRWGPLERVVSRVARRGLAAWRPLLPPASGRCRRRSRADRRVGAADRPTLSDRAPSVQAREARRGTAAERSTRRRGRRARRAASSSPPISNRFVREVVAEGRPERASCPSPADVVEEVAALDVDVLVVAGARVAVDREVEPGASRSGTPAASRARSARGSPRRLVRERLARLVVADDPVEPLVGGLVVDEVRRGCRRPSGSRSGPATPSRSRRRSGRGRRSRTDRRRASGWLRADRVRPRTT